MVGMPESFSLPEFGSTEKNNFSEIQKNPEAQANANFVADEAQSRVFSLEDYLNSSGPETIKEFSNQNETGFGSKMIGLRSKLDVAATDEKKAEILDQWKKDSSEEIQQEQEQQQAAAAKDAFGVAEGEELKPEQQEKFDSAFASWETEGKTGYHGFVEEYAEAETPQEQQKLRQKLSSSGLTEEEIQRAITYSESKEYKSYRSRTKSVLVAQQAYEKGGTDGFIAVTEGIEDIDPEDIEALNKLMRENVEELAKTDKRFRSLVDFYEQEDLITERIEENFELENTREVSREVSEVLEASGTTESFNTLSEPAQARIADIVRNGGSTVVATMLQQNMTPSDNGYISVVSGVDVELNVADGNLYIVGEHAKENLVNRSQYKIDPPSPAGFDQTYLRMIVDQNEVASLAQPALHEVLLGLAGKFGDDAENSQLMGEDEANRFHNFIQLMFGEDNIEASQEVARLEDLGIIGNSEEGGQGFRVNNQRLERIHRAMVEYIPTATDNIRLHELGMNYRHFAALAAVWDYTGNDTILPNTTTLQQLTDSLPEDGPARTQALQEFCVQEGYL